MKIKKNIVFWVSLFITVISFFMSSKYIYRYCFSDGNCWKLWNIFNFIEPLLLLFLPILLFSIITYFLKDQVFKTWLRFTYWYTLFYILVILLLSDRVSTGWSMGSIFNSEFFAITLSGIFVIISLVLVIYKAISIKNK